MAQAHQFTAPPILLPSTRFVDMTSLLKITFLVKFCVFILTCGFAFPTVLVD